MYKGRNPVGKRELWIEGQGGHKEGTVMDGTEAKAALATVLQNTHKFTHTQTLEKTLHRDDFLACTEPP